MDPSDPFSACRWVKAKEDYLKGKRPHKKNTSKKDILTGRQRHRKTTSQDDDNLSGRQPRCKDTSVEIDLLRKLTHYKNWPWCSSAPASFALLQKMDAERLKPNKWVALIDWFIVLRDTLHSLPLKLITAEWRVPSVHEKIEKRKPNVYIDFRLNQLCYSGVMLISYFKIIDPLFPLGNCLICNNLTVTVNL